MTGCPSSATVRRRFAIVPGWAVSSACRPPRDGAGQLAPAFSSNVTWLVVRPCDATGRIARSSDEVLLQLVRTTEGPTEAAKSCDADDRSWQQCHKVFDKHGSRPIVSANLPSATGSAVQSSDATF